MDAVECTVPHRPQSGMLTLNKTHRLGGSYELYTKVKLFQLAKIKLHWYLQYIARNPPAGEALDTGHSGNSVLSLSLLTTSRISVWLGSRGPPVLLSPFCDSSSSLTWCVQGFENKGHPCPCSLEVHCLLFSRSWDCPHMSCDTFSDNLSKPFGMSSVV